MPTPTVRAAGDLIPGKREPAEKHQSNGNTGGTGGDPQLVKGEVQDGGCDQHDPGTCQQHSPLLHTTRVKLPTGYRTQLFWCRNFRECPYPVQMSADSQVATAVAVGHPRRSVIEAAWRAIGPGVEVLSSDDGGPLSRTVKRIIDPLVLRLRSNPQYSTPVVTPDRAAAMHDLIVGSGPEFRSAAAWFEALKLERRRQRIRTGNAQELYFPVCFELAVTKGPPAPEDRETAAAVLGDIHHGRDRTAIEVLHQYVADPDVVAALADQLDRSWRDVRAGETVTGPFLAELSTVLGPANSHRAAAARQRVWSAMIVDATPYNLGALAHIETAQLPWSIVELGLSSVVPQRPPKISGGSDSDRPLDRSVVDRVRATLRRALDRDALPDIPRLCEEEVDRACAPWGLLSEDKQATLVAGIEIAVELAPLDRSVATATHWRRRSRPGCARRPTFCMPGAISPRAARSIHANGKWSTTSPPTHSPT